MYQLTEAIGAIISPEDLLNRVMDLLSRIASWLGENEATLSAVVGIMVLAGALFAGIRSFVWRRGETKNCLLAAGTFSPEYFDDAQPVVRIRSFCRLACAKLYDGQHSPISRDALVRSGRGPQLVDEVHAPGDGRGEPDAVVRAGDIIVHGLRNGDNLYSLLIHADTITQRIVTANGYQNVNT